MDIRCKCGTKVAEKEFGMIEVKCQGCKEMVEVPMTGLETKVFSVTIGDAYYAIVATQLYSAEKEVYPLIRKAGFRDAEYMLTLLNGRNKMQTTTTEPSAWEIPFMKEIHKYIAENWETLKNGTDLTEMGG
jgi:hypothetical protein